MSLGFSWARPTAGQAGLVMALVVASAWSAGAKTVTITVATCWDSNRLPVQKKFDQAFMKRHPDIKVKLENGNWGTWNETYMVRAAAGVLPDIIYMLGGWSQNWIDRGMFRDLSPFIRSTPSFRLDDFYMEGLKKYKRGSSLFLIPYAWVPIMMFYNTGLLQQSGVAPPHKSWTMNEMVDYAKRLTRDTNGDGKPDQIGLGVQLVNWLTNGTNMMPFGGRLISADESECLIARPDSVKALEWWTDLVIKTKVATSGPDFSGNKLGMVTDGPWSILTYNKSTKLKWDVAHMPIGPAGRFTAAESSGFGITKPSKNPREAWIYLNEYISTEGQKEMWGGTLEQTSRRSAQVLDLPGAPKNYKAFYEALDEYAVDAPMQMTTSKIQDALGAQLALVYRGKKSASQAATDTMREAEAIFKRLGRKATK